MKYAKDAKYVDVWIPESVVYTVKGACPECGSETLFDTDEYKGDQNEICGACKTLFRIVWEYE